MRIKYLLFSFIFLPLSGCVVVSNPDAPGEYKISVKKSSDSAAAKPSPTKPSKRADIEPKLSPEQEQLRSRIKSRLETIDTAIDGLKQAIQEKDKRAKLKKEAEDLGLSPSTANQVATESVEQAVVDGCATLFGDDSLKTLERERKDLLVALDKLNSGKPTEEEPEQEKIEPKSDEAHSASPPPPLMLRPALPGNQSDGESSN